MESIVSNLIGNNLGIRGLTFFLLGLFSTTSCLAFVIAGHILSFYTIALFLAFVYLLLDKRIKVSVTHHKSYRLFLLWTLFGLLSACFGFVFFINDDEWRSAAVSYVPKLLLYFLLFYLLCKNVNRETYVSLLLKGIMFGIAVNSAWATVDAFIFYASGYSITNQIFRSYILAADIRYESLSLVIGNIIRSAGLNADPANIGMFAPILASYSLYSKTKWMYLLSIFGIFASVSIVAFVGVLIVTLVYVFSSKKTFLIGIFTMILLGLGIISLSLSDDGIYGQMIGAVSDRLEEKMESDTSDKDNARAMYWINFLPAVINTPTALVIGTGYGTASYAYINGGFVNKKGAYDPEQTYFSNFFDLGLTGFFIFLLLHFSLLKLSYKYRRNTNCLCLFSGMEGMMIAFMGYHYTVYSVSTLIVIAGSIIALLDINLYTKD